MDAIIKNASDVPPFVVGASNLDGEFYFKAGGPDSTVNPDSVFWICSQTKMITHLAALHLIEHGLLSLNTLVSAHIPHFASVVVLDDINVDKPTYKPATTPITVKHLLNYTSGLFYPARKEKSYSVSHAYSASHDPVNPIAEFFDIIIGELPGIPIKFEPGTDFVYGWNSDVLGFLVEIISGQSLEQYCKKYIFDPLGMKTSFYLTPDLEAKLVPLNFRQHTTIVPFKNQTALIERDPKKVFRHMGGVGLYSSMRDYLTLLRHLLQIHAGRAQNPILSQATVRTIFEPALPEIGTKSLDLFTTTTTGAQWGSAMAIAMNDFPNGGRKKGSAFWSGYASTYGFMDPATGICAVFGSQIIPSHDPAIRQLWADLESALYASL